MYQALRYLPNAWALQLIVDREWHYLKWSPCWRTDSSAGSGVSIWLQSLILKGLRIFSIIVVLQSFILKGLRIYSIIGVLCCFSIFPSSSIDIPKKRSSFRDTLTLRLPSNFIIISSIINCSFANIIYISSKYINKNIKHFQFRYSKIVGPLQFIQIPSA